jgi:hypothetical protein
MSLLSFGLVFLLIGVGFFLSWGNPTNANVTMDIIMGAIFSVIGIALVRYHPIQDATRTITSTFNRIVEENAKKLSPPLNAEDNIKRIEAESRQWMHEIEKNARARIHQISTDVKDMTADTAEQ